MLKKSLSYRVIFFLFLSAIIIFGSLYIAYLNSQNNIKSIITSETFHLKILKISLQQELGGVIRDLKLISKDHTLLAYLKNESPLNYKNLCEELSDYANLKKIYRQIRFIDSAGNEIVRINYDGTKSYTVSGNKLQNKRNRYYFKKTIKLNIDEIYVSKFDLNIEHGEIEKPFNPTIRFCAPVFDDKGNKKGVIVLSYLGNNLINQISAKKHSDMPGSLMLVNRDGYFLKAENKNQKAFGFMFNDKTGNTFPEFYPDEWSAIKKGNEDWALTKNGLFSFITIFPNENKNENLPSWKLVSHVTPQMLAEPTKVFNAVVLGADILLFSIMFIGLFFYLRFDKQRKKNLQKLSESEVKFRTIVDNAGDAMFISDLEGNIVDANKQACRGLGHSKEELIGMNVAELDPAFVKNDRFNSVWNKFELDKPITFEAIHKRKNGSIFPVEIRTGLVEIENNKYVLGFARDITERKNTEEKLQQYFVALDEAQKLAKLGFYERNVNTNEGFWSDGLYEIFGFKPDEVPALQESFLNIVHPEDLNLVKTSVEESLQNHQPSDVIHRIIRKDDKVRYMRAICRFVYDENDDPLLHRGTFIDITEQERQKKVEKVLSKISEEAILTDDIFSFIKTAHAQIKTLMDAPNLSVALYHKENDEYSFPYYVSEKEKNNSFARINLKGGCNDYVRRTKKPLFANKENFEALLKSGEVKLIGKNSPIWLGTPLLTSSGVIGVLAVQHYGNPNAYSENDLETLTLIANNIARVIERKQLLNQIKQNEKHFRQLFELSPAGILIEDGNGIIVDVNKEYCSQSGFSKEELIGRHISSVSRNATDREIEKNIKKILNGETLIRQIDCETKDYLDRTVNLLETRITLNDGSYGILSVADDITELKNAEKILRESEEKYRSLTESSIFGIVIHTNGIVKYANAAAKKIMEHNSIDDMYGQNVMSFIHPDFRELVRKRIKETSERSKVSKAVEEKFITNRGNIIDVEVVSIPIIYNGEKSNQVIFYDITERKKAREELIEKENYIHSVFCNIHENIFIMNKDYEIIDVNRKVLLELDYEKEEIIGRRCYEISHQNDKPCDLCGEDCYLEKVFETGDPYNYRHVHLSKNGEEKHVDIMMSPLKDKNGNVIKVIEAMRDITDLIKAERETQKSEAKFRRLFENNLAGVFETTFDGKIITCNNRFAEIYGYKNAEELIGKNAVILYDKLNDRKKFINKLSEEKILLANEYKMKRKDGKIIWVLENAAILDSGNIYGTEIDITERKNVIKELEENERKFKLLTESSPFGIIIHDNGILKYANKAAKQILEGNTNESYEGLNIFDFVESNYKAAAIERMEMIIASGKVHRTTDEKYITLKGNVIDVDETVIPLETEKTGLIQVVFADITERMKLQKEIEEYQKDLERKVAERTKELTESEDKYRVLAETSDAFIARMDKNGSLLYANSALLNASGKNSHEVIGKNHSEFADGKKMISVTDALKSLINKTLSENETQTMEMQVPWGGWVEWHFTPENKGADKQENVVIIGYDVTQKREAQQKLQLALEKEKSLNTIKSQLISTVSHEFRTPLTSIFSSIDLLEMFGDKWGEEKKKNQFKQMRNSIARLTGMLDDVLKISRMERGKYSVNFENVNLMDIIDGVLTETKPILTPRHNLLQNLKIKQKNYYLDKEIIRTILLNLLTNAIKYSPEGGAVKLSVVEEKNNIVISVSDQGFGIAEKDLKNIFSEFYRAVETSHIQGTGLGLSIVKSLADKIEGRVTVSSELGKGSKFTVTIPIKH